MELVIENNRANWPQTRDRRTPPVTVVAPCGDTRGEIREGRDDESPLDK